MDNACFSKTVADSLLAGAKDGVKKKNPELTMKPIKKDFICPGTDLPVSNVNTG